MKRKGAPLNGWIALDKPIGMTSTQAVGKVRRILNAQKVGHGGTLDPLATGILPIALGEATKTIPYIQDALKVYTFTVRWGEARTTDDMEGEVIKTSDIRPSKEQIEAILPRFIGDIMQTPPQFSAIKIDGERAYDIARSGEEVDLKPRPVYIETLDLLWSSPLPEGGARGRVSNFEENSQHLTPPPYPPPQGEDNIDFTTFRCLCGKGTYIRSLARDLAEALGTVGFIAALRRDAVGPMDLENAISLEKLEEYGHSALLPVETVLDGIPALNLNQQEAVRLKNGQALSFISRPDAERLQKAGIFESPAIALALYNGTPVALVTVEGIEIQPVRVLNL